MKHDDVRHKLSEYIDGSVADDEKRGIEEHLKTCPACAEALRELEKTVAHIRSLEEVEPPAWMTQKIMAHVRSAAEEEEGALSGLAHAARAAARPRSAQGSPQPAAAPAPHEKESLFRRLFTPFLVKIPLQAVGVLFLAVTAFSIYQALEPARKTAQTPREQPAEAFRRNGTLATSPQPAPELLSREERIEAPKKALPSKSVPRAPEYKALDMKPQQEPAAAPAPAAPQTMTPFSGSALEEKGRDADRSFAAGDSAEARKEREPSQQEAAKQKAEQAPARARESAIGLSAQAAPEQDRERIHDHFMKHDLPESARSSGVKATVVKVAAFPADLIPAHKGPAPSCRNSYRLDVHLNGEPWHYFYCIDGAQIRLIGKKRS